MENIDYKTLFDKAGTPHDYSESLYLYFFELGQINSQVEKIILKNISVNCSIEATLKHGYLCKIHIQNIPDIVQALAKENHAVYQVIRISKLQ